MDKRQNTIPDSGSLSIATDSASPPATNAPSQPTSTIQPTSATPTSSPSPTPGTTAQSSPAQTTSAAAQTTPSSQSGTSSSNASPTTSSLASSTISFTSQVATTFSSTDSAGSVVIVTSTVPEVVTTSISSNTGTTSSHNTGIIVGAVVGGVIGVALVALLLFCIRKRARKDEFDGNFDPDRVVGHADVGGGTLPQVDLADEVTPFPPSQPFTDQRNASMRQYGKSPYLPVSSSPGPSAEFYPHGTVGAGPSVIDGQPRSPPVNMYGTGPQDWYSPRPGASPPPSTVSNTTSSTRAAKEREAMGRGGQGRGLTLGTPQEAAEGSGDVVVHQDAGRAPIEEHAPPREIPPAYESIRQD
ncbi:hypothetical protein EV363DRAFT_1418818 [Boletus edulis]|nr:hypothetical protein EV363DRAFT_1418818 [Boletus edulis]